MVLILYLSIALSTRKSKKFHKAFISVLKRVKGESLLNGLFHQQLKGALGVVAVGTFM